MQANRLSHATEQPLKCMQVACSSENHLTLSTSVWLGQQRLNLPSKGRAIWMLLKLQIPKANTTPTAIR